MNKALILLAFVGMICLSDALQWRRKDQIGENKRRLVIIKNDHRFDIRAIRKDTQTKEIDAIQFVMDTNWVPRYVMRYFTRDVDSSDLVAARWSIWKIVEYVDNSTIGNNGFNPDEDEILSSYKLWGRGYSKMVVTETIQGDATLYKVCTDLAPFFDSTPRPDVTLCLFISDQRAEIEAGVFSDPNAVKWSLSISNYPYTRNDSKLALKVSFDSRQIINEVGQDVQTDVNEDAIELSDDLGNKALASWVKTVTVSGAGCSPSASVVRTVIREGEFTRDVDVDFPARNDTDNLSISRTIRISYFSFLSDCQPTGIAWDPDFGIIVNENAAGFKLPSFALIACLFAILKNFL